MKSHIVKDWNPEADVSVVVAECGATATIDPDGVISPSDFDFYAPTHTDKATCEACRSEHEARRAALRLNEELKEVRSSGRGRERD